MIGALLLTVAVCWTPVLIYGLYLERLNRCLNRKSAKDFREWCEAQR